ncbi:ATP-binding protein [Simiduia curdlanivorans]|uniref:histidine kinase n=1 Tax=Simiduia curdlanivorans TaxID=1492769 RepID=A0ABV8V2T1_9GAMM|nr:ATP-binding protein [Simiduia curdlanivorans]MDN3637607.1 ATP-binding protein [Simiduia curdlanivorans]
MSKSPANLIANLKDFLPGYIYRCRADADFTLLESNGQIEAVTGYQATDFLDGTCSFISIIHPDDLILVNQRIKQALADHTNFQIEYRIIDKFGQVRWVWETGCTLGNGEIYGFISDQLPGLGRQHRLNDAQRRVVAVASSGAVSAGDEKAVAEAICQHCTQWLGVERTSVWLFDDSQTRLDLVTLHLKSSNQYCTGPSLKREQYPAYFDALITGRAIDASDAATDPRTSEFAQGYLDVLGIDAMLDAAIRNGDQIIGVVCCEAVGEHRQWSLDDINFVAELADQFSQTLSNKERLKARYLAIKAQAANDAKSRFLATISHEIRTPLNGVLGMAELLIDSPLNAEQQDIVATLQSSGQLLLSVINDVLDYSKIEAGKFEIVSSPVDLKRLLRQMTSLFQYAAQQKNLDLIVEIETELPPLLLDASRLQQVIANLLSNAIKFSQRGKIALRQSASDNTLMVDVIDQGCGISDDLKARLFQPFEQEIRDHQQEKTQGTGLGLAISKRIVEAMGGNILVTSSLGAGSTFHIQLPLTPAPTIAPSTHATAPIIALEKPLNALCVWVAEDNLVNQRVIEGLLKRLGIEPAVFANGQLLLDALAQAEALPDIILMDCEMPVLDGLSATRQIKSNANWIGIPIIALTAHALTDYRDKTRAAGMDGYLTKPIQPETLKSALETTRAAVSRQGL